MAVTALLLALAVALHQLERLLPLPILPYPGVKLGLGNLVTLASLFLLTYRQALLFVLLRVLLTSALGSFSGFLFSLSGALSSFILMSSLAYTWPRHFSLPGLSVAGAVTHNFGQLLVAAGLSGSFAFVLYLPVLLFSGIISGLAIGLTAHLLLKALAAQGRWQLNPRLTPLL